MGFRSLCIESNCKCTYSGGFIVVSSADEVQKIHLSEIHNIVFSTYKAFVSAKLLAELAKYNIVVVFCDEKYLPVSQALPLYGSYHCADNYKKQTTWTEPKKKRVWQQVVRHKINKQAEVLKLFEKDEAATKVHDYSYNVLSGDTSNREAVAAHLYFSELINKSFSRNQDNFINAALNYGYAILLSFISREIVAKGYMTQIGISHISRVNEFNLACDLMEPFRPFVDQCVMQMNNTELNADVKHTLQNLFNSEVKYEEGIYKMKSVMSFYVQNCLKALNGDINPSEISIYNAL